MALDITKRKIEKGYRRNLMLAKKLYEEGFFDSYHVARNLKNLLRIRTILLCLNLEWRQQGYLEIGLYEKLERLRVHTQKNLKQTTLKIKEWEARVYDLQAQVESQPFVIGNERLYVRIQQLISLNFDLNEKLSNYHHRYEEVEADLLCFIERVDFIDG